MPSNPAMKAPLHRPAVPSWAEREFANDRAEQADPSRRSRPPAGGWRHRRARPGGRDPAISRRPQSRAARGGGDAGWPGAGAGRRRHRQDPGADLPHRPYPEPGPGAAGRNPLGHLHQQGGARDEAAARPHARPGRRRHAVARHLSFHRRQNPAHPCRTGAAEVQFHRARRRRSGQAPEAAVAGREHRRQALAGADARRPDRRLEESRADAVRRCRRAKPRCSATARAASFMRAIRNG